ncbi:AsmA family protein [uncultured Pseudodesulfovibrio sp.]|uniref:AsmA family protein n=1 Tax=uncultured Pseudodesulfovibrio sp. TaxID=2035858 RepID=UPI0029C82C33|nr:AsmA family protein [uncultured Pseudodesulfovibrio sp.]
MMKRLVRILVECLVALILVCTGLLLWVSYYIDTGEFRARFTETLEGVLDRPVTLKGDMDIAVWPRLALTVEDLSIGESPDFGEEPAVRFEEIAVSVKIIPLFAHAIEVASLELDGVEGVVVRNKQGVFNWQSLVDRAGDLDSDGASDQDWTFAVNSVEISDAEILFRDEMENTEYRLSGIDINTGTVSLGEDVPFSLQSDFSWADQGIIADLVLKGMVRIDGDGTPPVFSQTSIQAKVYGDFLPKNTEPGEFIAKVDLDWDKRTVALDEFKASLFGLLAEGNVTSGDLQKGLDLKGHITVHPFAPRQLIAKYAPDMPIKDVDGLTSSALASYVHVTDDGANFENLVLTLDDITVRGQCGFKDWVHPVFDFDLRADTIDLDRYLPLFATGTPFIWDDFSLPFFRAFRGSGTIRADGFDVLDTLISDIRLKVDATDKGISFDAGAIRQGMASLGGNMNVVLGQDGKGQTTMALKGVLDAESQRKGFEFLHRTPVRLDGPATAHVEFSVPTMSCPPKERSIYILQHLDSLVRFSFGQGRAEIEQDAGQPFVLDYSKVDLDMKFRPNGKGASGVWNCILSTGLKLRGTGDLESVNATVEGPVSSAIDELRVRSSGMAVKGYLTTPLLPNGAKRMTFGANWIFDSKDDSAALTDAMIQALETTVTGDARLVGKDKDRQVAGSLSVAQADPKRIVYLMTGENLRTRDADALRNASVKAQFKADDKGFTLSDLSGELDGTPIKGHVVATGYDHPLFAFSLAAGTFNLDRYLTPAPAPTLSDIRANREPVSTPTNLPLDFLRSLKLNGKVLFQEFTLARVHTESLEGFVRANDGSIHLADVQGALHGGTLKADLQGEVGEKTLDLHLLLNVNNMQAGPFMQDMAQREYLRGETDIKADLRSHGRTDDDILANLGGTASVRITNGSFKFTGWDLKPNPADSSRREQIGANIQRKTNGRTVFQRASSDAIVKQGVFTLNAFRLEAPPVLQAYGEGGFSLPANTIDLSIRNDFVAVPSVTLRLTGKLTDPKVSIPTGKIVNDTVRNILSLPKKSFEFLRDLF